MNDAANSTSSPVRLLIRLWSRFIAAIQPWVADAFLLLLRVSFGWSFFKAGAGKLKNSEQTISWMHEQLGVPEPAAWMAIYTEYLGGLMLMAGLLTRLNAAALAITMLVAFATVHTPDEPLEGLNGLIRHVASETPGAYLLAMLSLWFFGPGRASLDHLLGRWLGGERPPYPFG